jgi:excisionase family DNA binding protein
MAEIIVMSVEEYKGILEKLDTLINVFNTDEIKKQNEKAWLTQEEAKKTLNVGVRTLQNYRDNGTLSFSKVGRKIRYRKEDVESLLQKNYVKGFSK